MLRNHLSMVAQVEVDHVDNTLTKLHKFYNTFTSFMFQFYVLTDKMKIYASNKYIMKYGMK